ncbi:uncharacterized protein LOC143787838 [Ranitomeya variabilis]|uniref:uncharacterized protein LOC143787838 n=1 Tax=Ranitomeya variabilis TaxID=490064 RepID=UPI004056FE85
MQKPKDLAKIIRSNVDLAGAPLLALILLGLEKLMETEFVCPNIKWLQILYSLTFIIGTTAILCVFVCSCWCCNRCGTRSIVSNIEQGPCTYQDCIDCECCGTKCCSCFSEYWYKVVMRFRVPIFWILILITDGRYIHCLFESNVITTTVKQHILQIIQMVGLGLIFIFAIVVLCKCQKTAAAEDQELSEVTG